MQAFAAFSRHFNDMKHLIYKMKNILSLLLFVFISIFECSAQYGEWINIRKEKNGAIYLRSDELSLDNIKKVWIKDVQKKLEIISEKGKKIIILNGYTVSLREFDCTLRKSKLISYINYNSKGKVIYSAKKEDYEQSWEDVAPDTVGEFLLTKTCELF